MPKGVYKRTSEICQSLSIAAKKRDNSHLLEHCKNGLGRACSEETRKKISKANKGKNHGGGHNKGILTKEEIKKRISESLKGNTNASGGKGRTSPWKNKKHTEKSKKIIKEKRANQKIVHSDETKNKIKIANTGKKATEKTKKKLREIRIQQIEKMYNFKNGLLPNYNNDACELFDLINKDTNTNGQFATNGGERKISGYFLDYINDELKMIIEYDERYHYDISGNLKKKDIERQKIIQDIYPDYKFIRIKGV